MENIRMPLRELIDTAKERLQELQYAPATINALSRYWRELLEYAEKVRIQYFSVTLGEDYLREVCHIDVAEGTHDPDLPRWKVNPPKRAVYLLVDLQNSGSVLRKAKEKYTNFSDSSPGRDILKMTSLNFFQLFLMEGRGGCPMCGHRNLCKKCWIP